MKSKALTLRDIIMAMIFAVVTVLVVAVGVIVGVPLLAGVLTQGFDVSKWEPFLSDWRSKDGIARIVPCSDAIYIRDMYERVDNWRPATLQELLKYKEEFPQSICYRSVYAGASLYYLDREDPNTHQHQMFPLVTGYFRDARSGGFSPWVRTLSDVDRDGEYQLLVRKDAPIVGTFPSRL